MKQWTTTWGTSSAPAPRSECNYAKNTTFRYGIPILSNGEKVRISLSNLYSNEDCSIVSASIGFSKGIGEKKTYGVIPLTFKGKSECEIKAFSFATSDEIDLKVKKGDILNVSFYIKDVTKMATATPLTGKYSYGFICEGNYTMSEDLPLVKELTTSRYYFISQVDVLGENESGFTFFGDSITSFCWTDELKTLLIENEKSCPAIVRKSIAGGEVWIDYDAWNFRHYGASGIKRFEREICESNNCDNIFVFHGINDIIHPNNTTYRPLSNLPSIEKMIDGFKYYVDVARKHNKKIYFTTILPFKGWRTYDNERNEIRKALNEWIRTTSLIDGYVDFDMAIRDENDFDKIPAPLTDDNLHPSLLGAKLLAKTFYDKFFK